VSHDRRFLENVSTRTLCFTAHGLDLYEGGFKDYEEALERVRKANEREAREARERKPEKRAPAPAPRPAPAGAQAQAPAGADAYRARREQARDLERKTKQVALLEGRVTELEAEVAHYKKLLVEATGSDWEKLHEWAKKERELSRELEKVMQAWLSLSEEVGKAGAGPEAPPG
jgi:ATP-binding cassette subfamily F protein 3